MDTIGWLLKAVLQMVLNVLDVVGVDDSEKRDVVGE